MPAKKDEKPPFMLWNRATAIERAKYLDKFGIERIARAGFKHKCMLSGKAIKEGDHYKHQIGSADRCALLDNIEAELKNPGTFVIDLSKRPIKPAAKKPSNEISQVDERDPVLVANALKLEYHKGYEAGYKDGRACKA